jgi:hypothetical protein
LLLSLCRASAAGSIAGALCRPTFLAGWLGLMCILSWLLSLALPLLLLLLP